MWTSGIWHYFVAAWPMVSPHWNTTKLQTKRLWALPQMIQTSSRQWQTDWLEGADDRNKDGDRTKICGYFFGKRWAFLSTSMGNFGSCKMEISIFVVFLLGWFLGVLGFLESNCWMHDGKCFSSWKMTGSHILKKLMPFNSSCFKHITYTPSIWQTKMTRCSKRRNLLSSSRAPFSASIHLMLWGLCLGGWWLNQPIWNSQKMGSSSSPKFRAENSKHIWVAASVTWWKSLWLGHQSFSSLGTP